LKGLPTQSMKGLPIECMKGLPTVCMKVLYPLVKWDQVNLPDLCGGNWGSEGGWRGEDSANNAEGQENPA
jgi:hypothetical protein